SGARCPRRSSRRRRSTGLGPPAGPPGRRPRHGCRGWPGSRLRGIGPGWLPSLRAEGRNGACSERILPFSRLTIHSMKSKAPSQEVKVIIVEDESLYRDMLGLSLARDPNIRVVGTYAEPYGVLADP